MQLPSISNLNNYISYVNQIQPLTQEEEFNLSVKKDGGDLRAAQLLILSQLKTVVYIAKNYLNYGLPLEELIQEGNIGLMKAVKRFDSSNKVRLYTYALIWIKAEIQEYIINNIKLVKIATTKNLKKLFFNYRKNRENIEEGINRQEEKIIKKLGVNKEEINDVKNIFISDTNIEDVEISTDNSPEKIYLEKEKCLLMDKIKKVVNNLSENESKVINNKYLTNNNKMTNKELSKIMNVSAERVRQIEVSALDKIKELIKK